MIVPRGTRTTSNLINTARARAWAGDASALKWAIRDLPALVTALEHLPAERAGVAVQAGGNLGVYPWFLSAFFELVYTFEPAPALFPDLAANCPERNVIRFQAALGATVGGVKMSQTRRDGKPDPHAGITHVAGAGPVPMIPLDCLRLPRVDFLALDLEGYELWALEGAAETIARCRPWMLIEINKSIGYYGRTREDVRGAITARGYEYVARLASDELWRPIGG